MSQDALRTRSVDAGLSPASRLAAGRKGPPLVIVSNRLNLPGSVQTGGLATALDSALEETGGLWLGWSGALGEDEELVDVERDGVRRVGFPLSQREHRRYYAELSNRTLWPLLHSRPDLVEFHAEALAAYLAVNRRIAGLVARHAAPEALVWIHDYHLLPLPALLRQSGMGHRIGVFLHTPVPAPDMLRVMPGHDAVFGGLLGADLVGVQTAADAAHLSAYLSETFPCQALPRVEAFPIGIDAARVAREASSSAATDRCRALRESLAGRKLVIGVDRLDYSKGLPERFEAYGQLFERHPSMRRAVSFLQIAPVSRGEVSEYRKLKTRLDAIAGSINGRHADADWMPLRYVSRSHSHTLVSGFLRAGSVGLVTPLRDGMNLVAKEYVAAQNPQDPGVLVLSRFAGAAAQMKEALLVNPLDRGEVADTLATALKMSLDERRHRWTLLMRGVERDSIHRWTESFIGSLSKPAPAMLTVADIAGAAA